MLSSPFIERSNERRLPTDYDGDMLLWDIDKTYLDTHFGTWKGLATIPLEFAIDKKAIPGSVPLLRALRRGPRQIAALTPLYFVSGSPPQLRSVIERKMTLDGVQFDGITFKDQLELAKARRFKEIKAQVWYKLLALLHYRNEAPHGARWLLFGDDVESDAMIFSLFGEICADLRGDSLRSRLSSFSVAADHLDRIVDLAEGLPLGLNPIERIFIHMERGRNVSTLTGPRTIATYSFLQTALLLYEMQRVSAADVAAVASDLRARHVSEVEITSHLDDARNRLGVKSDSLDLAARPGG